MLRIQSFYIYESFYKEVIMIEIKNLTKKYKDTTALDNVSLTIGDVEFFGLLGVNGAGKSTMLNILSTLVMPTSGDAFIDSHSVVHDREYAKSVIGISTQTTAVAQNLTVKENLEFMANIYGFTGKEAEARVAQAVEAFSLGDKLNARAKTLSGGYQRRLSIALSLIGEPKIIFLDEPSLGLDVIARRELWSRIRKIGRGKTVILTTHYLEEAQALCERICIMNAGRIMALGSPSEIVEKSGEKSFEEAFIKIAGGEM